MSRLADGATFCRNLLGKAAPEHREDGRLFRLQTRKCITQLILYLGLDLAGLLFVDRVGAGAFAGLIITANILMSLAIDHFGWFNLPPHPMNIWRALGAVLMVGGMALISRF
jgi:hypothetical protein